MVGSAIKKSLEEKGYTNLVYRTRKQMNLLDETKVANFFREEKPDYVFLAAAKVGGIIANRDYPAEFIYDNLKIQLNLIHQAYLHEVKGLCFLGSTCIYPKLAPQPLKEEYLLTGALEPTNEAYAIAKIAGMKMCQFYNQQYKTNFIFTMPTSLYGINDSFDPQNSHVIPALMRRLHEAKLNNTPSIKIWGTGKPKREFMYVDDLADALVFLMNNYKESELINIGIGEDMEILEIARGIAKVVGYTGEIETDPTKPDGTPRKLVDTTKLTKLGWKPKTDFERGLKITYNWFLENYDKL
jgi:GDP-L-fucose synthase